MKFEKTENEKLLLTELKKGSEAAFEQLYNLHKERMAGNLLRMLKSYELVEEMLQELFVRIWDNRQKIDPEKSFAAYLYSIATNLVKDYFRKIARDRKLMEAIWQHISIQDFSESLSMQIKADEELMRTIDRLPTQRKKIFKLCKLDGKSYQEVAQSLGISEAAVNDHITKANRFIKENYDKYIFLYIGAMLSLLLEGM